MRDQKEAARRHSSPEHSRRSRDLGISLSSWRSARSEDSSIHHQRPRGFSFASIRSNAITDGSQHSVSTNALVRRISNADDSDASDSNSSLGETEHDVWFPNETAGDDIHVEELDQLLHDSDNDSSDGPVIATSARAPTELESKPGAPQLDDETFDADNEEEGEKAADPPGEARSSTNFRLQSIVEGCTAESPLPEGYPRGSMEPGESPSLEPEGRKENSRMTSRQLHRMPSAYSTGPFFEADQPSQRFSFYAAGLESTIHAPDLASLAGESESFTTLLDPKNGAWFLDCFRPTDLEMKALSRAFGIHPLTTEDIQVKDAREKYEQFANYYLVVYHTFDSHKDDPNYMESINFYILAFKEGVISFHFEPVSHCRNVRRRMRQLRDYVSFTPDWIAYALIDDITDSFAPEISAIEHEADYVEDAVYLEQTKGAKFHELLQRLGLARRHTMQLLRMLSGKADVVRGFAKRCAESCLLHNNEMKLYLGDIEDHVLTMYQNLSAYEKIFSRTHFNYMGLLQMHFVDASNQMTKCLGYVSVLGSVLLPMNIVTGLWGMNVHVPGQDAENVRWFFSILAVLIFVAIVLISAGVFYLRWMAKRTLS